MYSTTENIVFLILLIIAFVEGFFIGKNANKPHDIKTTKISDTIYKYVDISGGIGSPLTIITHPQNKVIETIKYDTILIEKNPTQNEKINDFKTTFISVDTLRFDSLYVSIVDSGGCNGIINRHSTLGGKMKTIEITNTITNTVETPINLFQLNAGITSTFNKAWNISDIAPTIQLDLKRKYFVSYSYGIQNKNHSLSILTKIK